ncbi:hypothetical protein GCM10027058_16290 [Microbacterium neimengense]
MLDIDREAEVGHDGARLYGADAEVEHRDAVVGAIEAERLARQAEFERGEPVLDDDGDSSHQISRVGRINALMGNPASRGTIAQHVAFLP